MPEDKIALQFVTGVGRAVHLEIPADPMQLLNAFANLRDHTRVAVKVELTFTKENSILFAKGVVPILNEMVPDKPGGMESLSPETRAVVILLLEITYAIQTGWDVTR